MNGLPDWLLRGEGYQPRPDRDAFLDRSILALLAVLAWARPLPPGPGRAEPLVKLGAVFAVVLLVALTRNPGFLALAGTGLLITLALQDGRTIARVLRSALAASAFTVLVLLPSVFLGRGWAALSIGLKVLLSVTAVQLAASTTPWPALSGAFKRLGAPDLFLLVFDLSLKYITLLGEFALAQLQALKLRSVGRNPGKTAALGAVTGTLFLQSKERAEDMFGAMECRGFTGQYRARGRFRPGWADGLLAAAVLLLIAAYRLTRMS